MKYIFKSLFLSILFYPIFIQAACGVHDQTCRFHSIGSQHSHIGKNLAHHTKGIQQTPAIPNTPDGLYFFGAWQDNSSGSKADLDLDVLLPDAILDQQNNTIASGPFIVSNNAHLGGAPANTNPFGHIPNQADRHVDTFQYQITFANNTATSTHSQDANGLALVVHPVQTNETCDTSSTGLDSCEYVHVKGNIPSGIYGGAVTNYDIHNLADPSTPLYAVWAVVQGNVNGDLVYLDNIPVLTGGIQNRGETSPIFSVGFVNRNFNSHAEGVVLYNYQTNHSSNLKYGDIYKRMQGNYLTTYQDTFRDHWKTNRRETINAQGIVSNKENLGTLKGSFQKRVYAGTNLVNRKYIAPPPPKSVMPVINKAIEPNYNYELELTAEEIIWTNTDKSIIDRGITADIYQNCYSTSKSNSGCLKAKVKGLGTSFAYETTNAVAGATSAFSNNNLGNSDNNASNLFGDLYDPNRTSAKLGKGLYNYNPNTLLKNGGKSVIKNIVIKKNKLSGKNPPINTNRQKAHVDNTNGKSQFKDKNNANNLVKDSWDGGKPQFNSKGEFIGKIKQYKSEVGTQGQTSIDVRFSKNNGIHGFPSNKVE